MTSIITQESRAIWRKWNVHSLTMLLRPVIPLIAVGLFLLFATTSYSQPWNQLGSDFIGKAIFDEFGSSVSLSSDGSTLAIGAPFNSDGGTSAGQVRVYSWNGSSWIQRGAALNGENASDHFGSSVCLNADGTVLAVGSPDNDDGATNGGEVRVYAWNGSAWVQRGTDFNANVASGNLGTSLALSSDGSTLAMGGPGDQSGFVQVYKWTGSSWNALGLKITGEMGGDESGTAISLSSNGNVLAIGSPENSGTGPASGHVRVFDWSGSAWVQKGADIDGEDDYDESGSAVSLNSDGNTVAIGAPNNKASTAIAGHVRVYMWNGSAWTQKGGDMDGNNGDYAGTAVSLSANGNTVAVGRPGNGTTAGEVRIYSWNGSAWINSGADINGDSGSDDELGHSVSLSSNGGRVAVGTPYASLAKGYVRVFSDPAIGIDDKGLLKALRVFPNPTTSIVYLDLGQIFDSATITVTDLTGRVIMDRTYHSTQEIEIDTEGSSGFYLININTRTGASGTIKVMKK